MKTLQLLHPASATVGRHILIMEMPYLDGLRWLIPLVQFSKKL